MIGCLDWQTYHTGHRTKLKPDRVEAIWYSARNCGVPVAWNSVDNSVTKAILSTSLRECEACSLLAANSVGWRKRQRLVTCRWITSLAGGGSFWQLTACRQRQTACGCLLGLKLHSNGSNRVNIITRFMSVPVRLSAASEWRYSVTGRMQWLDGKSALPYLSAVPP